MGVWRVVCVVSLLLCSASCIGALTCDWSGSGVTPPSDDLVTRVTLDCSSGAVEWSYPRGALSVTLKTPAALSSSEFSGCLRFARIPAGVVRLQQRRRPHLLHPLWTSSSSASSLDRWACFESQDGQVMLYLEVEQDQSLERGEVRFEYDLQPVDLQDAYDPLHECRPCSSEEFLHSFCTSDFVVSGQIVGADHLDAVERSRLTILADRIVYDNSGLYSATETDETVVPALAAAERYSAPQSDSSSSSGREMAVHVPRICDVTPGGETRYILTGRRRLGVAMVTCSMARSDWLVLKLASEAGGLNQCVLDA